MRNSITKKIDLADRAGQLSQLTPRHRVERVFPAHLLQVHAALDPAVVELAHVQVEGVALRPVRPTTRQRCVPSGSVPPILPSACADCGGGCRPGVSPRRPLARALPKPPWRRRCGRPRLERHFEPRSVDSPTPDSVVDPLLSGWAPAPPRPVSAGNASRRNPVTTRSSSESASMLQVDLNDRGRCPRRRLRVQRACGAHAEPEPVGRATRA